MPSETGEIRGLALEQALEDKVHVVAARDTELEQARLRYIMALIVAKEPRFQYQIISLADLAAEQGAILPRTLGETARIKAEIQVLQQALASGRLDLAVCHAVEAANRLPARVELCAYPPRQDPRDVLVLRQGESFEDLRQGARLALDGRRREAQLIYLRPDLQPQPVSGTIESRLELVVSGEVDGAIVAACDLLHGAMDDYRERLNFLPFSIEAMCPRPGQGQLLLLASSHRARLRNYLHKILDDKISRACAEAEILAGRALGYEQTADPPAACHVSYEEEQLILIAMNAAADQQDPQITRQLIAPRGSLNADPSLIATAVQSLFGEVAFIGAGPGAPDLMTLRGQRLLEQAQVIVYDRLTASSVLPWADPEAEQIFVSRKEEQISEILIRHARRGKRVVRLTVGDPLIFDSGAVEAAELREAGIAYEIVPGLSSLLSVPAFAGMPLTHPGLSEEIHLYDGRSAALNFAAMVMAQGSLVFVNAVTRLPDITTGLILAGLDPLTPAAVIQEGTLTTQRTLLANLETIARDAVSLNILPPALLVIGEIVRLAPKLNWFPPHGRLAGNTCALITNRSLEADPPLLAEAITAQGGMVLNLPLVQNRTDDGLRNRLDKELGGLLEKRFHQLRPGGTQFWIVLNTPDAVTAMRDSLTRLEMDYRKLSLVRFAVTTIEVAERLKSIGLGVDYRPENGSMDELASWLASELNEGDQVVSLSGKGSQSVLSVALQVAGVPFSDLIVYETSTHLPGRQALLRLLNDIDLLIFTSGEAVVSFSDGLAAQGWSAEDVSHNGPAVFAAAAEAVNACRNRDIPLQDLPASFTLAAVMEMLEAYVREKRAVT